MARREAPKHIIPTGELDLGAVLDAVRRDLARLDAAAVRTREQFGRARVVDDPILGAFSVDQWLKFHLVHPRHHEKQIRARRKFLRRLSAKFAERTPRPALSYQSDIFFKGQ